MIHPIILHVFNGLALSLWMLLLFYFSDSYLVITIAMGKESMYELGGELGDKLNQYCNVRSDVTKR